MAAIPPPNQPPEKTEEKEEEKNYAESDPSRHIFPLAALTTTLAEIKISKPEHKSKLTSKTLKGIADYIRTEPKQIILLTGAGISTNGNKLPCIQTRE